MQRFVMILYYILYKPADIDITWLVKKSKESHVILLVCVRVVLLVLVHHNQLSERQVNVEICTSF